MFCVSKTAKRVLRAGTLMTALVWLAGCGSLSGSAPAPAAGSGSSGSFTDRMSSALFGPPAQTGNPASGAPDAVQDCPVTDFRAGGTTLAVNEPRVEPTPMNLRYQASLQRLARECAILGATITMKVGVEGRIVVGPAGGPGQMELPIRYTVVHEGPNPRTIMTKFHRVPVMIPAGAGNIPFAHVDEDLTFPVPPGEALWSYVVYVGFDPEGLKQRPQVATKKRNTRAK
jgi:hypothetical protein